MRLFWNAVPVAVLGTLLLSPTPLLARVDLSLPDENLEAACGYIAAADDEGCINAIGAAWSECSSGGWLICLGAIWNAIHECQIILCGGICVYSDWGDWVGILDCLGECFITNPDIHAGVISR